MKKLFIMEEQTLPIHIKNLKSIYQFVEIGHGQAAKSGHLLFNKFLYYIPTNLNYKPLMIDLDSLWMKLSKQKIVKTDLLVKALKDCPKGAIVVDACAGSLKDALFLLKYGFQVLSFEKNRIIYDLLTDALCRCTNEIASKIDLRYGDFLNFKNSSNSLFCYLDPMFTHERKALPKKNMVIFEEIIFDTQLNEQNSSQELLKHALRLDFNKVIVKRADKAKILENIKPTYCLQGKTIRLDIYMKF